MSSIDPNSDPYAYVGLIKHPDGSITRRPEFLPTSPASSDPANSVLTKDIPINEEKETWARLYLPQLGSDVVPTKKLPLIVYYHGGGFVICSAASPVFQKFLFDLAMEIPAVIVSVEYRLAPEDRLPAAYEDCMEALDWIKASNDVWLKKYADLSNCYLMGTSAGGNIAYHVGLRAINHVNDLVPLKIQGLILHQPYFGGVERTTSEIRLINDEVLPLVMTDLMWELSLPVGADRDHEYCNPMEEIKSEILEKIKDQGWILLVTVCDGDPLVDRQVELVKMLESKGMDVIGKFSNGGSHGYELVDESKAKIFNGVVKNFVLFDL